MKSEYSDLKGKVVQVLHSYVPKMGLGFCAIWMVACDVQVGSELPTIPDSGSQRLTAQQVNWETVPEMFNPQIEANTFTTQNIDQISLNIFGFNRDVRVIRSPEVPAGQMRLLKYKVWNNSARWGALQDSRAQRSLNLGMIGASNCQTLRVANSRIVELDGSCIVRMDVLLPRTSQIRVFNLGRRIN